MVGRLHQELQAQHVRGGGAGVGEVVGLPPPGPHVGDGAQVSVASVDVEGGPAGAVDGRDLRTRADQVVAETDHADGAQLHNTGTRCELLFMDSFSSTQPPRERYWRGRSSRRWGEG